jgi:integrase
MSAYKDIERGTWYCQFRYTDYQGRTHRTTKRGFRTKKEAVKYEQDFRARAGKADIRDWKNELMQAETVHGKKYASSTLHTITAQLSTLFNYAIKYYDLAANPLRAVGTIGKRTPRKNFWTVQQFRQFIAAIDDYPLIKLAFNILFYSGMRAGELIALSAADFDVAAGTINISKTASRETNAITSPKTPYSVRVISMPPALGRGTKLYKTPAGAARAGI